MARTVTITQFNSDANMIPLRPIKWLRSSKGNPPPKELINPATGRPFLAANGQYFAEGDMCHIIGGAVYSVANAATHPIAGFVVGGGVNDPTGATVTTATTELRIMPVRTGDVYSMNFWAATPTTATNSDDITALVGAAFNIETGSVFNWNTSTAALESAATNTCMVEWLTTTQTAARVALRGLHVTTSMPTSSNWLCRVEVEFLPVVCTWTHSTNVAASIIGPNLQFDA